MASILAGLALLELFCLQVHGIPNMIVPAPAVPFNGTNPLFPDPTTFRHTVQLTYRSAHDVIGPICDRKIEVGGSVVTVDVAANPAVFANQVRVQPQVIITEPQFTSGGMYTLVLASQPLEESEFGAPTKPIIHWIQSDIELIATSSPITLSYFVPFMPVRRGGDLALVMLYQQPSSRRLVDPSVTPFVDNDCVAGPGRCSFDVEAFAANFSLNLVFASTFTVRTDRYALALYASLPFVEHGCYWLDKYEMKENVLLADKIDYLEFGITAKFVTPAEVIGPVCTRVFQYKADKVKISWESGKPVPARKVRTIPWLEYGKKGEDMAWKDDWYTLAYVSQVTDWPEWGSPEKPILLWLVTNIHGNDISGGMCDVPYLPATPVSGSPTQVFMLFKQKKKVEINPADFSEGNCVLQYRCQYNINKMAEENELMLVGAQTFQVAADPHSVALMLREELATEQQVCNWLRPFGHEGKLVGECLPKFTSWSDLWEKFKNSQDEKEKDTMKSKLAEMCPELGKDFSSDTPYHGEMKENADAHFKKFFLKNLMEKMFNEGKKMDEKMDENKERGCGKELIDHMMKMKTMWAMDEIEKWGDKEKEFGPCMKAVMKHLKAFQEKDWGKNEKDEKMMDMKETIQQSMKEKMEGFMKHMVMRKISEHLGMDSCGEEGEEGKLCADPQKIKMLLWHKHVQMKKMKQGGKDMMSSMEQKEEDKMGEHQSKEIMFFKSIMSMMEQKNEKESSEKDDSFPLLDHFLENNAEWKKFCEDW